MTLTIRSERPADASAIENVTITAFRNVPYSVHNEQHIVHGLRKAGKLAVSLVVEEDGLIVGHVAASPVSISDGSREWYGLGPVSIVPERQGRGMGTELTKRVLSELRKMGASGCVVLGDPAFYQRFGFKPCSTLVLPGVPSEYFQVLKFRGGLPTGTVTYHESFTE